LARMTSRRERFVLRVAFPVMCASCSRSLTQRGTTQELDEARKAGNAPAEVDVVTGRDINPHIPNYILKTPWYYHHEGASLLHQRNLIEEKEYAKANESYNKGFVGRATQVLTHTCNTRAIHKDNT
jgi:hypothetical protein